jgi:hypothetical protein
MFLFFLYPAHLCVWTCQLISDFHSFHLLSSLLFYMWQIILIRRFLWHWIDKDFEEIRNICWDLFESILLFSWKYLPRRKGLSFLYERLFLWLNWKYIFCLDKESIRCFVILLIIRIILIRKWIGFMCYCYVFMSKYYWTRFIYFYTRNNKISWLIKTHAKKELEF